MATNTTDPWGDYEDLIKGRSRTTTQRMIEALMARAGQPNPSLGGALANGLSVGLMGLIDKQDENKSKADALSLAKGQYDATDALPPVSSPPPLTPSPSPRTDMGPSPIAPSSTPPQIPGSAPTLAAGLQAPAQPPAAAPTVMAQALTGVPTEKDMAEKDVADSLNATGAMPGMSPGAVGALVGLEFRNNPRERSGSYVGATQMGPKTFAEAPGGRLGGLTYPQYQNGSLTQQMWAYPDWLQQYRIPEKLQKAGVDTASLNPAQQYGVLQAAQFAPNGDKTGVAPPPWMSDFNRPSTGTPQATVLGDKSVNTMAASQPGQNAAMNPTPVAQQGARPPVQQAPPAYQGPQSAPADPRIADYATKAEAYVKAGRPDMAAAYYRAGAALKQQQYQKELEYQAEVRKSGIPQRPTYSEANPDITIGNKAREQDVLAPGQIAIAGEKAAVEAKRKAEAEREFQQQAQRPAAAARLGTINENVDRAIKQISDHPLRSAGPGSLLAPVPYTYAHDLAENLRTLGSIASIEELQQMRASSPTGGAVGNVSNYEDRMFAAVRGSLDQGQTPEQLKANLERFKRVANAIANPVGKTIEEQEQNVRNAFGPGAPEPGKQSAPSGGQFNYDAIKPGQTYTAPDGSTRTKR